MDCQVKWVRRLYARHEARYALPASAGMTAKGTRQRLSLKDEEKSHGAQRITRIGEKKTEEARQVEWLSTP